MARRTIQVTKNYGLFHTSLENRPLDPRRHKLLEKSMREYGFLPCFPIVVVRDKDGNLVIKDGQHRLSIAQSLGLPVYWVEEETNFDVALVNSASKGWNLRDYAAKYAENGSDDYREGIAFADRHGISIGASFSLLAGSASWTNVKPSFLVGKFVVKDRAWADAVASVYAPVGLLDKRLRNQRFMEACMAVCRVPEFDQKRFLQNCERCRDKLASYSTRDAYLRMIEDIYNFGRQKVFSLKIAAEQAMKSRNLAHKYDGVNGQP